MDLEERVEQAVERFENGYLCSQSVLLAYTDGLGLNEATAARIALPFGAGMGRMGWTCGAVTGALMAIGLKYGHEPTGDPERRERVFEKERQFLARFLAQLGSAECPELLGRDISTASEYELALEEELFQRRCTTYVAVAVEILGEMLEDE